MSFRIEVSGDHGLLYDDAAKVEKALIDELNKFAGKVKGIAGPCEVRAILRGSSLTHDVIVPEAPVAPDAKAQPDPSATPAQKKPDKE